MSLCIALMLMVSASPASAACGNTTNVANETELNTAIDDFNRQTDACSYTITLTADIALTTSTTTINNANADVNLLINGADFEVNGQDTEGIRVFNIAVDTLVTMDQITITGGYITGVGSGGGIANAGNLTLTNSALRNNVGTNGGGIFLDRSAVTLIQNSTISGNSGQTGGGIHNTGDLTLIHATLSGNIEFGGGGGATIANFGKLQMQNSIFANSVNDTNCLDFGNSTSLGYNLVDDGSCEFLTATGDLNGVNPLLSPLANNGGNTETFALQAGSPAIDHIPAGVNECGTSITTDQRGIARPQGTGCDSGAFEVEQGNHAPIVKDLFVGTNQDTAVAITLPAVDEDGDALTFSIESQPNNGTLSGTTPNLTYTPVPGFNGNDSFTYRANDGQVDSAVATVTVIVNAVATPFATCGGYDVFETAPGVYAAPSFPGNLMVGDDGYNWLQGTDGPDLILGLGGSDDLWGRDGDDVICGGTGVDIILGQRGNDILYGDDQPDWLIGGPGNDTLYGGNGWDDLEGNGGEDVLYGEGGSNVLLGGSSDDDLFGGDEPDALFGQDGNDDLDGGGADDYCKGGRGTDTITNCEGASAANLTVDDEATIDEEAARHSNDGPNGENAIEQRIQQLFLPLVTNNN